MQPVTPYIWQYQPQTGDTAGARQDYGSVINWFSSSPLLCQRIAAINNQRNIIDKENALLRNCGSITVNESLSGMGVGYDLNDGRQYRKLTRDMLPFPHGWQVYEDGAWRNIDQTMTGAGNALSSYPTVISAKNYLSSIAQLRGGSSTFPIVKPSTGMDPLQFARKYPPVVYNRPFSEPSYYFPKEFSPLWDPNKDLRGSSAISKKYRNIFK